MRQSYSKLFVWPRGMQLERARPDSFAALPAKPAADASAAHQLPNTKSLDYNVYDQTGRPVYVPAHSKA